MALEMYTPLPQLGLENNRFRFGDPGVTGHSITFVILLLLLLIIKLSIIEPLF